MTKYTVEKLSLPIDGIYKYNVKKLASIDGGKTWWYSGFGRYAKSKAQARRWIRKDKKNDAIT